MSQSIYELMMTTKANEYLIAVSFLIVFCGFWTFVSRTRKGK